MIKKRIHLIYSIVLSVVTVIAGLCLIAACISIYNIGDRPFSPQAVAAAFSTIALPVYLCLALILVGFILDGFFPASKGKPAIEKQHAVILAKLHEKADLQGNALIRKEQRNRKLHRLISLGLLAAGSVVFLCYGANSNNFDSMDITGSMIKAMYVLLPCMAIPFAYGIFSAFYCRASLQREIALAKQAIAAGAEKPTVLPQKKKVCSLLALRWALLAVGIVLLVYGFFAGGTEDVLTKAVNICTECVGLG